jgi:4-carboxymuconolactone decarboxylase
MAATEARFRQLELAELDEGQRRVAERILDFIGGIDGPFNSTLRSPEIMELTFALGDHLLFGTTLPRRLVELAILIRARVSFSQFEWYAHRDRAEEVGLSASVCEALRVGRRPETMADDEAAVFDFSVELLRSGEVSDATFERARDAFGERGVVELIYLLGFYGMIALCLSVAQAEPSDGSTPLEPLDDPFSSRG